MQTLNDVGEVSIGGTSILAVVSNVQWQSENERVPITSPLRFRDSGQQVKRSAQMTVPLSSVKSGANRVSHMDLTLMSLAAQSVISGLELVDATVRVTNNIQQVPNVGEYFRRYQCDPGGGIAADLNLQVADTSSAALALLELLESDDPDDKEATFAMTINAVATSVVGHIRRGTHDVEGRQKVTIAFESSDPGGVTFPSSPAGTSTLYTKAINAPKTPLAFEFVSHATAGLSRTGYCLIRSAEFRVEDAQIVKESYAFQVTGDWTTVSTAS